MADSKYPNRPGGAGSVARAWARIPVSHQQGLMQDPARFWFSQPPGAPVRAIQCQPGRLHFPRSNYLFRSFENNSSIPHVTWPGGRPQQVFRPTVSPYGNHGSSCLQKDDVAGAQFISDNDEDSDSEVGSLQHEPDRLHHFHLSIYRDLDRVGAYSPKTRRRRVDRYLEKRKRKKWKRTIKYQVRKAFALQRARKGGRFVKGVMGQTGDGDKAANPTLGKAEVPGTQSSSQATALSAFLKDGHNDKMSRIKRSSKTPKTFIPQNSNQGTCVFCHKKNIGALGTHRRFCTAIPGHKLNSNRGDCERCGRRNIGALGTHLRFCTGSPHERRKDTVGPKDVVEVKLQTV